MIYMLKLLFLLIVILVLGGVNLNYSVPSRGSAQEKPV